MLYRITPVAWVSSAPTISYNPKLMKKLSDSLEVLIVFDK